MCTVKDLLKPLRAESLKDVFVSRFEELILSGKISIGERLPSERELALRLGVSRPVVHDGLRDLVAKGLVSMKPRVGTVVNDYRKEGSLAVLASLVNYENGGLDPWLLESLLETRMLIEVETARVAAARRSREHLEAFDELLRREGTVDSGDLEAMAAVDFSFHHQVAMATGNLIYPLLLNSFRQVYTSLSRRFFSDPGVAPVVFGFHRELAGAIRERDGDGAAHVMKKLLVHGSERLQAVLSEKGGNDR